MCGIFGYIAKHGRGPNLARLRRIALETETRGRHAFGLAWLDRAGGLHTFKRPGAASAALDDLDRVRDATIVVGHCRWATHGSPADNRNNHPHPAGRGWLVHNGVVHNHTHLARQYDLAPRTQCDSEVLGLLLARMAGPIDLRAARTAEAADGPLAILGVWARPARLLVARRGKPLSIGETDDGSYFGSLAGELPGMTLAIPDGYAGVLSYRDGAPRTMKTAYYVATLARYVVVEAESESQARELGAAALHELYADLRAKLGGDVPIEIQTLRPATSDEIDMVRTHERMVANERRQQQRIAPVRVGDRIRLVAMQDDPDPIQIGELGTVTACRRNGGGKDAWYQIDVAWDNGRTLMLVSPPDQFEIVARG